MKILKNVFLILLTLLIIGVIIVLDINDRNQYYSKHIPEEELKTFYFHKNTFDQQKAFERNFGLEKYKFPREKTFKIKLYNNTMLFSRLTSKTISNSDIRELVNFFNNPVNFHWSETTWSLSDLEYILRFYNIHNEEIGKIWLCIADCGMTETEPFSPNMKYGGISKKGKEKLDLILRKYN